jgi:hypothetical protein
MKKDKDALVDAGKKISNLYAFLLTVRWSAWLLDRIPQVEKARAALLQTPSGQTLQVMFGASLGWKFCVDVLLGKYGLLLFAAGCSICWCASHFPTFRLTSLTNMIRSTLQKPFGQKVANRFYLRVFQGNHEEIYDLGRPDSSIRVRIEDSALLVTWKDGTPCLQRGNDFICSLHNDKIVPVNKEGAVVEQDNAFVTLQFILFKAMILVPNQRR